jgi:tetratricopeptide (TPR) repeat protein
MAKLFRAWILLAVLAALVVSIQIPRADLAKRSPTVLTAPPVLPRPEIAQTLSFGLRNLLADWYWLQFVQYFGDIAAREKTNYHYSAAYLELITALDPQFIGAYSAASYAVAEAQQNPDRALQLMRQGIARNQGRHVPLMWSLYQRAAGVAFLYKNDYGLAAQYFEAALKEPGAPRVLQAFAAAFYRANNDWERAIPLWIDVYLSSPVPQNRKNAKNQLLKMGVWLKTWGNRPSDLVPDRSLLQTLKITYCPTPNLTPQPLPGFNATYFSLQSIKDTCRR